MKELAIGLLWLIGAAAYLVYRKPKGYRDLFPLLVTITCCAAAFFAGAYVGGDAVKADLATAYIDDDDFDLASQLGGNAVPLFEVMVVCTVALLLFFAVRFVVEIVEDAED